MQKGQNAFVSHKEQRSNSSENFDLLKNFDLSMSLRENQDGFSVTPPEQMIRNETSVLVQ
jgi:hypothetical protein